MARRNTIQKDMVLKTVRELKRHLTADEVYGYIKKDHPNIGKEPFTEIWVYWQKKAP